MKNRSDLNVTCKTPRGQDKQEVLHKKAKMWCVYVCVNMYTCTTISGAASADVFQRQSGVSGSLKWSLRVSLDLWGIGTTNGTRPVGLRTDSRNKMIQAVRNFQLHKISDPKIALCPWKLLLKPLNAPQSITILRRWTQRWCMYIIWHGGREWACVATYPQPLVHTLPVEFMAAGQDSQQLAGLKIAHTHHAPVTEH